MQSNPWTMSGRFRLLIVHSTDGVRLADELVSQLPGFGFACCSFMGGTDVTAAHALLNTMDGMAILLTPGFQADPICHQAAGFALGRGVHLHAIEISAQPAGFLTQVPTLVVPTDSALPRLIAQFVARDPLSSQRLSTGAVDAIAQRMPAALPDHLACLESLRIPSSDAVVELKKIRQAVRGEVERSTELRLDRLIERWQQQIFDDAL